MASKHSGLILYTSGEMEAPPKPRMKPWRPKGSFRFLDLPSELRNRIYELALSVPEPIDLSFDNYKRIAPHLRLLQTSKMVYQEAYPIFYGSHTIRIFPTHASYLNAKQPVLMRLPRHYRRAITQLELRLGPGWSKIPKCQTLGPRLGLKDCTAVRVLKVFVEIDPNHPIFTGYRINDTFYTVFASGMLEGILRLVPSIAVIEFDAYPSVRKTGSLMSALLQVAETSGRRTLWGQQRGWELDEPEEVCDDKTIPILESALASITL